MGSARRKNLLGGPFVGSLSRKVNLRDLSRICIRFLQHVAAAMGYDDCVRFLISSGADVNVKGKTTIRGSEVALSASAFDSAGSQILFWNL